MRALFLILFVLIAVPSQGKMTASEIKELAFTRGVKKPFFYKIEYFGKTSYLLGTMHWGVSIDELPPEVEERFNQADQLVLEIVPLKRINQKNLLMP